MVEFRLNAEGDLELQAIGEALQDHIWEKAFPLLAEARGAALADGDEPTNAGKEVIRKAVQKEKQRLAGKKRLKTADTELGKSIQRANGRARCFGEPVCEAPGYAIVGAFSDYRT